MSNIIVPLIPEVEVKPHTISRKRKLEAAHTYGDKFNELEFEVELSSSGRSEIVRATFDPRLYHIILSKQLSQSFLYEEHGQTCYQKLAFAGLILLVQILFQ